MTLHSLAASLLVACALALPNAAHADDAATCAAGLSESARMIYDAVIPQLPPPEGETAEDVMRGEVRPMVRAGDLRRGDARDAAQEAGPCLRLYAEENFGGGE